MSIFVLVKTLAKAGIYYGISQTLLKGEYSKRRLTKVATGVFLIGLSLLLAYVGILALIGALFFFLAGMADFVRAALITGIVVVAVAALVLVEAYRYIRS